MTFETMYCVVDNRVLTLGIDAIYRASMRKFESVFLLPQVEIVAGNLGVSEAEVPIEGYYGEEEALTRYFKLMRALQEVPETSEPLVRDLPEFQQIWDVTNSLIFGKPVRNGMLLPQGRDPISQALHDTTLDSWKAQQIIDRAYEVAIETDDISLVGLAVNIKDPIAITAVRESVVLYAEPVLAGIFEYEYVWGVDDGFASRANRFIDEFNRLIAKASFKDTSIPGADSQNAARFYYESIRNDSLGRCVKLGFDRSSPRQFYHWAITQQNNEFAIDEFWDTKLWTTKDYRTRQEQVGWKFLKDELKNE